MTLDVEDNGLNDFHFLINHVKESTTNIYKEE